MRVIWFILILIIGFAGAAFLYAQGSPDESLRAALMEVSRAKQWVTVSSSLVRSEGWRIVARVGETERVVYQEPLNGPEIRSLSLSPSGEKLAFVKILGVGSGNGRRSRLCTINIDGSNYTELFEFTGDVGRIAWSPDQRKVSLIGQLREDSDSLVVLDVSSHPVTLLVERPLPLEAIHTHITTQAWAPDNERLVYVNADGRMVVFNIRTKTEEALVAGDKPTWSPDGAFIAYRADVFGQRPGDYFLMPAVPPRQPRQILSNKRSKVDMLWLRGSFLGEPLWAPDGRFILIMRLEGLSEFEIPYVLEVSTRRIERLPMGSMGDLRSWGGKP